MNPSDFPPLPNGFARLSVEGELWDVPIAGLDEAIAKAPSLKILASTPDEWVRHVNAQIQSEWNLRFFLTPVDVEFLEACAVSWGEGVDTAARMREKGEFILVGNPTDEGD